MTTRTLTVAEFILARLDEDEREAESWIADMDANPPSVYDAQQGIPMLDAGTPDRVLAQCAALRAVVRRARRERARFDQTGGNLGNPIQATVAYETVLRDLATIWRDHTDFDPAWAS